MFVLPERQNPLGQIFQGLYEATNEHQQRQEKKKAQQMALQKMLAQQDLEERKFRHSSSLDEKMFGLKEREFEHTTQKAALEHELKNVEAQLKKAQLEFQKNKFGKQHDLAERSAEMKNALETRRDELRHELRLNTLSQRAEEFAYKKQFDAEKMAQEGEQFEKKHGLSVYDREHKQIEDAYKEQAKGRSREAIRGLLQELPENASPIEIVQALYQDRDILPEDRKDVGTILKQMKEAQTNAYKAAQPRVASTTGARIREPETGLTPAQKQELLRHNIERSRVGQPPLTPEEEAALLGHVASEQIGRAPKPTGPTTIEQESAKALAESVNRPLKKGQYDPEAMGIQESRANELEKAQEAQLKLTGKERGEQIKANRKYNTEQLKQAKEAVDHFRNMETTINNITNLNNSGQLPGWFGRALLNPETGDPGQLLKIFGSSAAAQLMSKDVNSFISNIRGDVGAVRSNYEIDRYMAQFPTLLNTEQGRRVILRQMRLSNDLKKLDKQAVIDVLSSKSVESLSPTELYQEVESTTDAKRKKLMAEMGYLTSNAEDIAEKRLPDRLPDQKLFADVPDKMRFEGNTIHNDKKQFFTYRNGFWEPSLGKKKR